MVRRISLGIGLLVLVAACGSGEPAPLAVVANAPGTVAVGEERLLVALISPDSSESLATPEGNAVAEISRDGVVVATVGGDFLWTVPDVRGLYRFATVFDEPGTYTLVVSVEGLADSTPNQFAVVEDSVAVDIGDAAPRSTTPTGADHDLAEISTDPTPDPRFYRATVAEAVGSGRPSVIVFATPAFCTTATCGPTLDVVKAVAPGHPNVEFVHVEVYENLDAASFEDLVVAPAVLEWGLPSEPWVFVVDATGTIVEAFEGVVEADELGQALAGL